MVLEIGVNEVSNINLNVEPHVRNVIVKNHMEKLFLLAVQSAADYPDLTIVLLDRLPRLDSTTRAELGKEADQALATLWDSTSKQDQRRKEMSFSAGELVTKALAFT